MYMVDGQEKASPGIRSVHRSPKVFCDRLGHRRQTMNAITVMNGSYDYGLVTLSVVLAMFASYAALDLAGRVTCARAGHAPCG